MRSVDSLLRYLNPEKPGHPHLHPWDWSKVVLVHLGADLGPALTRETLAPVPVVAQQLLLLHLFAASNNVIIILTEGTEPLLAIWHFGQSQTLEMVAGVTLVTQDLSRGHSLRNENGE